MPVKALKARPPACLATLSHSILPNRSLTTDASGEHALPDVARFDWLRNSRFLTRPPLLRCALEVGEPKATTSGGRPESPIALHLRSRQLLKSSPFSFVFAA